MKVAISICLAPVIVLLVRGAAPADVIHLKSGNQIEVTAWREVGDEIEFALGGGIVRIAREEVARIEGEPTQGDLQMLPPRPRPEPAAMIGPMRDLVAEAMNLHYAELRIAVKAGRFSELVHRWDRVAVSDAFREMHQRGQSALRLFASTLTAARDGVPDPRQQDAAFKALDGLWWELAAASKRVQ